MQDGVTLLLIACNWGVVSTFLLSHWLEERKTDVTVAGTGLS